jgi:hypothetical protein
MEPDKTANPASTVPLDHFAREDDEGFAQLHRTLTNRSNRSRASLAGSQSTAEDEKFDFGDLLKDQLARYHSN